MMDRLRRLLRGDEERELFVVMVVQHADAGTTPSSGLSERGREQAAAFASSMRKGDVDVLIAGGSAASIETAKTMQAAIGAEMVVMDAFGAADGPPAGPGLSDGSLDRGAAQQFLQGLDEVRDRYSSSRIVMIVTEAGLTLDALRSLLPDAQIEAAAPGVLEEGIPSCAITTFEWREGSWKAGVIATLTIPDI